jgi:Pyridine nucleotide-disulphide oxidoreductase, dimerisation domain
VISTQSLFIDPPLGRVGITETEARASGQPLLVGHRPMTLVGRAVEKDETKGFMKVVVDAQTSRILGAAILGTGGDEAIHGLLDVMSAGIPYTTLQQAVPIHPTVSELIPTMLGEMRAVSSPGLVPEVWQPQVLCEPDGRVAAPIFFWGGKATRARGSRCTPIA